MASSDITSYIVLGVVIIGGFWLVKNGPALLMQIQAGGGLGGGGGGLGGGGGGLGGGDGGFVGTGGGGGGTDFCASNPNDPTCQLSGSSIQLGPGTTSTSQITRDIVSIYNNQCKPLGCPSLPSRVVRGLPVTFRSSYNTLSMLARNSQDYIDLTQSVVKALVSNVSGAVCAPCASHSFGVNPTPTQLNCTPPHSLSSSQYSGTCASVCDSCGMGFRTCFLGTFNGARKAICTNCGRGDCASLRQQFLDTFQNPSSGGGGGGTNTCPPLSHCGGGGVSHCTKITSGPYSGHCVGDECGPGGAGSIMSNGNCSRSNPPSGGGCSCVNHIFQGSSCPTAGEICA